MRLLVLGAGGIGGYFGGRLAAAGVDVRFLVRPRRAAQLAETGLVIKSPLGDLTLPVKTVVEAPPSVDAVLLACKAYDLEGAMTAIAPAIGPSTCIVPLLNGVRHLDHLMAHLGEGGVALGSDFDGAMMPAFLQDAAGLPKLTGAMQQAGYGDALITIHHARYLSAVPDLVLRFILCGFNGSEHQPRYGKMKQAHAVVSQNSNTYGRHR